MKNNYSLEDALKKMLISKDINSVRYQLEYDIDKLLKKNKEKEWKEFLDSIDIVFIEKYIRSKKLLNLENKK